MTANLTGNWEWDGGTVALLELDNGSWIAAEPRIADDLLGATLEGETITVEYEGWQVVGGR